MECAVKPKENEVTFDANVLSKELIICCYTKQILFSSSFVRLFLNCLLVRKRKIILVGDFSVVEVDSSIADKSMFSRV